MQTPADIGYTPVASMPFRRRALGACGFVALLSLAGLTLNAQTPPRTNDSSRRPDDASRRRGGTDDGKDRRNMSPQDMQARYLSVLRDRLNVENDDEWAVISERMMKVSELRRAEGGGAFGGGFRGGPPQGGGGAPGGGAPGGRTFGGRGGGSPEAQALQQAVADKLPDAEIKLRLEKLRDTRLSNDAKLAKAQDELRAVLSLRQEATLVLLGLLR